MGPPAATEEEAPAAAMTAIATLPPPEREDVPPGVTPHDAPHDAGGRLLKPAPRPELAAGPREREAEPVVRVNIGRVEVKAVNPPPPPPRPAARSGPPQSLDSYLEERDRRRR